MTEHDARELAVAAVGLGCGRFLLQAARCRGALHRRAARVPHPRARRGELAAARADRRHGPRGHHRRQRCDAHACAARSRRWRRPAPRCSSSATAAPARSSSPARCTGSPAARTSPSWRSTARPFPRRCSRASSSATRRAPSPGAAQAHAPASWRRPTAAPSSSTRSARCRVAAGEAAARAAGAHGGAHRRPHADPARPAHRLRHQPQSRGADRQRRLSRGPLLPHQRSHDQDAAAARPAGRQPAHRAIAAAADVGSVSASRRRGLAPDAIRAIQAHPLARQRARAREPHQGRGHHGRRRRGDRQRSRPAGSGRAIRSISTCASRASGRRCRRRGRRWPSPGATSRGPRSSSG